MLAPSRTRSRSRLARLLVQLAMCATAALAVAGCAAPGAARLRPATEGLPSVFDVVTDDVIAVTVLDPDPAAPQWAALRPALGDDAPQRLVAAWATRAFGDAETPDGIGATAGTGWRTVDVAGHDDASSFAFADVRDRGALEADLRERGWRPRSGAALRGGDDVRLVEWRAPTGDDTAIALGDEALVSAPSSSDLRRTLRAGAATTIADRRMFATKVVDSSRMTPMALVFRTDIARGQFRRRFQADPATLELAGWATSSGLTNAVRDGWIGLAPAAGGDDGSMRLVGAADWLPTLAGDWKLEGADRSLLEQLPGDVGTGVALHDAGALGASIVRTIGGGGVDFATELDVPTGTGRIEIFPLLERFDGDAAAGWRPGSGRLTARFERSGDEQLADDLRDALELAGVPRASVVEDGDEIIVQALGDDGRALVVEDDRPLGDLPAFRAGMRAAGVPDETPVVWIWQAAGRCRGPAAGWVQFNGGGTLGLSIDVAVERRRGCSPVDLLARL